jgi:glycosyltransferase involved in cell wall biosynthesis
MTRAFSSLFHEVREVDYLGLQRQGRSVPDINRGLIETARDFRPDWIWLQVQETGVLQPEALLEIRRLLPACVVTHWTGDCRVVVSPYLSSICKSTHVTFNSSVGQAPLFLRAGAPEVQYCQIGVDWEEDVLGLPVWTPPFRVPDVVLCGNYYGKVFPGTRDREEAVRRLEREGVDVGIVGSGWPRGFPVAGQCGVKQQYHVWSRAKVGLNVNHFNTIERYYSDRQLISMASGTPVVCKYVPGLEKEFVQGRDCLWYDDPADLVLHVLSLLKSEERRRSIGAQGRETVMRSHTWWNRILGLLPVVERLSDQLSRGVSDPVPTSLGVER